MKQASKEKTKCITQCLHKYTWVSPSHKKSYKSESYIPVRDVRNPIRALTPSPLIPLPVSPWTQADQPKSNRRGFCPLERCALSCTAGTSKFMALLKCFFFSLPLLIVLRVLNVSMSHWRGVCQHRGEGGIADQCALVLSTHLPIHHTGQPWITEKLSL